MLLKRFFTALILIPLTLVLLYFSSGGLLLILTSLLVLYAGWEWTHLMGLKQKSKRILYLVFLFIAGLAVFIFIMPYLFWYVAVWWLFAIIFIVFYPASSKIWGNTYVLSIMGCFILLPCWLAINEIRWSDHLGFYKLLFLFVLIWGADSIAYFVGRKWGRHKLCPVVSPGKSIEGAAAALIGALLIAFIVVLGLQVSFTLGRNILILSVVTVFFSIVGDLTESMVKRYSGIKDSGNILPGHGGLLDRIDSLTAAAPIFTLGLAVLNYQQNIGF